jgi:hypothetical protein
LADLGEYFFEGKLLETFAIRRKLIFVLGSQRSGTTAMLQALGQDPSLQAENESPGNELYEDYRLRPEPTIRPILWGYRRRIILKPVADVDFEPVEEIVGEFKDYDPLVVWLYRDPVNVWSSAKSTFDLPPDLLDEWIRKWRAGNESLLTALSGPLGHRFIVVRYEDLISQRTLFNDVCRFLEVEPRNNLFWKEDRRTGRLGLPTEIQKSISDRTSDILAQLDRVRHLAAIDEDRFVPKIHRGLATSWSESADPPMSDESSVATCEPPHEVAVSLSSVGEQATVYHPLPSMPAGEVRIISFWMKTDEPVFGTALVSRNAPPWDQIGPSTAFSFEPTWKHIGWAVPAEVTLEQPRLHIELPSVAKTLYLSDVDAGPFLCQLYELYSPPGYDARLLRNETEPEGAVIEVSSQSEELRHSPQLTLTRGVFEEGVRYRFRVRARSQCRGDVAIFLTQSTEPWDLVSDYQHIHLSQADAECVVELVPRRSGSARLVMLIPASLRQLSLGRASIQRSNQPLGRTHTHHGAEVRFEPVPHNDAIRLVPKPGPNRSHSDVQWELPIGPLFRGLRYALSLRVRADAPRAFGFGLSEAQEPWRDINLYHYDTATTSWRDFYFEVVTDLDFDQARILVDVGASETPVEIDNVRFRPISDRLTEAEKSRLAQFIDAISSSVVPPLKSNESTASGREYNDSMSNKPPAQATPIYPLPIDHRMTST